MTYFIMIIVIMTPRTITTAAEAAAMMTMWRVDNPEETGTGAALDTIVVACGSVTVVILIAA